MAYKSVIPSTNVTVTDVRDTLGVTDKGVGSLCKSPKVNMWSRWKPLRGTQGNNGSTNNPKWGIEIPTIQLGPNMGNTDWIYRQPTGTASSPYRLGDFRNYYHEAKAPFQIEYPLYGDQYGFAMGQIDRVILVPSESTNQNELNANDFEFADRPAGSRLILGLCLVSKTGEAYAKTESSFTNSDRYVEVVINRAPFIDWFDPMIDYFWVYPFLSYTILSEWTDVTTINYTGKRFYPFPKKGVEVVNLYSMPIIIPGIEG